MLSRLSHCQQLQRDGLDDQQLLGSACSAKSSPLQFGPDFTLGCVIIQPKRKEKENENLEYFIRLEFVQDSVYLSSEEQWMGEIS